MTKLSTKAPKGTRDFLPVQAAQRQWIFDRLRAVFEQNAYSPIETPAMESLSTLMGKYGEEGDRLIFKILNSGDYLNKADQSAIQNSDSNALTYSISEKALRYDLTVPFARFVVENQNDLKFPFKRYQIQPVWRADRPQKGRYREFFQCDVDVIGTTGLWAELELLSIVSDGFKSLGLDGVQIKLNNRKVLAGVAEVIGKPELLIPITVAIDKLDKIGLEGVEKELSEKGLSSAELEQLRPILQSSGELSAMDSFLSTSEIGKEGLEEMKFLLDAASDFGLDVSPDFSLARGLNYYTGSIIEVVHLDFPSSICGGGRYDDLTGIFGLKDVSGVGISFGADRIYDLLEEKGLFPESLEQSANLLFLNMGDDEAMKSFELVKELQGKGMSCSLFPDNRAFKKQMKYANDTGVELVAIIGSEELAKGEVSIKNMKEGSQVSVKYDQLASHLGV